MPVVGLVTDRRVFDGMPVHQANDEYVTAVRDGSGALPLLIPSSDAPLPVADILAAIPNYGRMPALSCVREAIAVARKQSALALELRSTVTLARFLSQSGERDQARQELSLVCGRFTEGFKTPDFTAARHLIEALT